MISKTSSALSQKSELAYKQLSDTTFFTYTISMYTAMIVCAIVIKDVTKIFDSLSAFGSSCLVFLFPGGFFLMTYTMLAKDKYKKKFEYKVLYWLSIVAVIFGVVMAFESVYFSIAKLF